MSTMPASFLDAIFDLAPWLGNDAKKELAALIDLLNLFPDLTLKEIVDEFKKYKKKRRSSPEGFLDRLKACIENIIIDGETPDDPEVLIRDFATLPATTIKSIGKKIDLTISSKKDVDIFAHWLRTGEKPPSAAELLRTNLEPFAQNVRAIRDNDITELSSERIKQIVAVIDEVKTKYKKEGVCLFAEMIGYPPLSAKDTMTAVIKMIRQRLSDLAIARLKAQQIGQL